jgi:hypothetical protein
MIYELVVTSVPRGLQAGRSGFTTVLRTRGIHPELGNRLEAASGYRHVYAQGDPRNPQIRSHTIVQTPVGQMCVLSRIIDAGNDYSGRSNKLAHHLAFDAADVAARAKSSPAAVLLAAERSGIFQRQWAGEPREQPTAPAAPNVPVEPGPCAAWARAAGDAGWAGFLVDRALKKEPAWIIAPPGVDLVELYAEALALVNYPQRWSISFTTYALTTGDALWLGTVDGSPEAQSARGQQRIAVVDLVRRPALTVQSPTIDAARGTGQVPWKRDMSRPAAAASVAAAAVTSAGLAPGQPLGPAIPVTGPVTLPPAIGGASGGPPRLGGPVGSPPPIENKKTLGGPPSGGPWGTGPGDDLPSEPAGGGGFGLKVLAASIAVLVLAGLGVTAWLEPEFGQRLVAWGGGEKQTNKPVNPEKDGPREPAPPPPVSSEIAAPQSHKEIRPPYQPPAQAGDTPSPLADPKEKPIEAQLAMPLAAPQPLTPEEKWKAFQAERAKPDGRYPKESLFGEKPEKQVARICKVDDVEFDLVVPTTAFTDFDDVWQLDCGRPDNTKREWEFGCLSWKEAERRTDASKPTNRTKIGSASVNNEGWLVVTLDPLDEKQRMAKSARQALACAPLTFKTPLHPAGGTDLKTTFAQLRRPAEYGPIVIEDFFANKRIWQKKLGTGDLAKVDYVALKTVAVPLNPWPWKMTTEKKEATLVGSGARMPRADWVGGDTGQFPNDFGAIQIQWNASFSKETKSVPLLRTDVEVQLLDDPGGPVLGVRIGHAKIADECINYDLLAHLNRASAIVHREGNVENRLSVDLFFPITEKTAVNFRNRHLDDVQFQAMLRFVQVWLPLDRYSMESKRNEATQKFSVAVKDRKSDSLGNWLNALREFVADTKQYIEWCAPPEPLGAQPGDANKKKEWEAKKVKFDEDTKAFEAKKKKGLEKPAEFAQWLQQKEKSPEDQKAADGLVAVCTAIEKLPAVETGKRETLELLASMADADLQITGALVVWESSYPDKQCVLATFTAGKEPVVVAADDHRNRAADDPQTDKP